MTCKCKEPRDRDGICGICGLPIDYAKPAQARFDSQGEVTAEPLLAGDSGVQGSLLGSPASTGESLALDDLPMFGGQ